MVQKIQVRQPFLFGSRQGGINRLGRERELEGLGVVQDSLTKPFRKVLPFRRRLPSLRWRRHLGHTPRTVVADIQL